MTAVTDLHLPLKFEVEYRPFRLISSHCLGENIVVDKKTFYISKIGEEKWASMEQAVGKWMEDKGIPVSFSGVMSQTTRAHRLSRKAYKAGGQYMQLPLLNSIFKAYVVEQKDIGDLELLAQFSEAIGLMSKEDAIRFLESDELEEEVKEMANEARSHGISGVPVTIIDGKWAVKGSQRSDAYIQIFKKLAACGNSTTCPEAAAAIPPESILPFEKACVATLVA